MVAGEQAWASNRSFVWLLEVLATAILMGPILYLASGIGGPLSEIAAYQALTGVLMIMSGYVLTSAILAVVLARAHILSYPSALAALWLVHIQVLSSGISMLDLRNFHIKAAGACVVFICGLAGSHFSRKAKASSASSPSTRQ